MIMNFLTITKMLTGHHGVTPDMSHSVGVLDLSNETPQLSSREVYGYDHEFRDWL